MGFLDSSEFIFLLSMTLFASFLTSWHGMTKERPESRFLRAAGAVASNGLFLEIGCLLAALLFIGWRAFLTLAVVALIFWPVFGYVAAVLWVKAHPRAKLLTPWLAAHLCRPRRGRNAEIQEKESEQLVARLRELPRFQAVFDRFGIDLSEAEGIHRALRNRCGPKTADTVLCNGRLLTAYLEYYAGAQGDRHDAAAHSIASDLDFPEA